MTLSIGDTAPDITLEATSETTVNLAKLGKQAFVLYFYPKDSTPGCTTESQDFRDLYPEFQAAGVEIFGVSRDKMRSHENFKAKLNFPFELISDPDEALCTAFDVIKEKNMYGKKFMGIERSTFLFGADGKLAQEWRKVKVKEHAKAVLEAAQAL